MEFQQQNQVFEEYINELDARPDLEAELYAIDDLTDISEKTDRLDKLVGDLKTYQEQRQHILGTGPK